MEPETPLKTLSREEETVVKKLAEIHNAISDGRVELDKVTASLQTAYNDRRALEDEALRDLYQDSKDIVEQTKSNFEQVVAFNAQAQETFAVIKKLADTVERATRVFESKSSQLLETYDRQHAENSKIKQRLDSESKQLDERKKGLDKFHESILKMAAQVDSKVEALKALKK